MKLKYYFFLFLTTLVNKTHWNLYYFSQGHTIVLKILVNKEDSILDKLEKKTLFRKKKKK